MRKFYLLLCAALWTGCGGSKSAGIPLALNDPAERPQLLVDHNPGSASSTPTDLVTLGGKLYCFAAGPDRTHQLCRLEGKQLQVLTDFDPAVYDLAFQSSYQAVSKVELLATSARLFFTLRHWTLGTELWTSDGTPGGTTRLPQRFGSLDRLHRYGEHVVFNGVEPAPGHRQAYISDGTPAGTRVLKPQLYIYDSVEHQGVLYLAAADTRVVSTKGHGPNELWRTDGTSAGTRLVYNPGGFPWGADIHGMMSVLDKVYFIASDRTHSLNGHNDYRTNTELWVSDGTEAGTGMVADLNGPSAGSFPSTPRLLGDHLYFTAIDRGHIRLFSHDVLGNTLTEIHQFGKPVIPRYTYFGGGEVLGTLAESGSLLVFEWAYEGQRSVRRVWRVDPATGQAEVFRNFADGEPGPGSDLFRFVNGRFARMLRPISFGTNASLRYLQTDGSLFGTGPLDAGLPLRAMWSGGGGGYARLGNQLYFIAQHPEFGIELCSAQLPAHTRSLGGGCSPVGHPPRLHAPDPVLGRVLRLALRGHPALAGAVHLQVGPPTAGEFLGCRLHLERIDLSLPLDAAGTATLRIPSSPSLVGTQLVAQASQFDAERDRHWISTALQLVPGH